MNRFVRRNDRGQTLVEFALILPVLVILLVGIFDLGHVVWTNDGLSNAAREAARYAIVHGGSDSTPCPVGPAPGTLIVPPASSDCPYPSPSIQSIKDKAEQWLQGVGGSHNVYVCYGDVVSCTSDTNAVGATNVRGTRVTVTVTTDMGLSAPALLGIGPFHLSASTTMLVSH
jgi:Flp pilus assembly pilin Flp